MTTTNAAREALETRIDAYLDGQLSVAEARATERMFVDPEVGAVLAEALALRELLRAAPDAEAPAGLAERIIAAVGVDDGPAKPRVEAEEEATPRLANTRRALYGASWIVRGGRTGRAALPGASSMRYALGPLGLSGEEAEPEPPKRSSWWRPMLGLGRSR